MYLDPASATLALLLTSLPLVGQLGDSRVQAAFERAAESESLAQSLRLGISAVFTAIGAVLTTGVFTLADLVIKPAAALADVSAFAVEVIFGSPLGVILAGADETMRSLTGGWSLGPFTLPFAVIVVLLTFWIVQQYLEEPETGNLFPTLPFDIPFLGADEEGEDKGL